MESKASIKTHPIHPILIPFPVAFFIGTLLFDVLSVATGNTTFENTAKYLETGGMIMAVIAAIPGIIDFIYTVPPRSSAKKRTAKHGIINTVMLLLFLAAYIMRINQTGRIPVLIAEACGVILLFIASWMGGTLVHRNQIGVYNRYARSGKWKEEYFPGSGGLVPVADKDELKEDQMKLLHIGEKRIVLGKTATGYVAFEDRCSHKGGSLAGGVLICGTVQCPWHGSQFDTSTGEVKAGPAKEKIHTFPVSETNEKIYIQLRP